MKTNHFYSMFLVVACAAIMLGTLEACNRANSEPQTVTLLSRDKYNDYERACFSFEHGINGKEAIEITQNDWDVQFGNGEDFFHVTMVTDDRSRIKDLGELNWSGDFEVPVLPAHPDPQIREPSVAAVVGHMYVVHTKDTETDLYALFRVESLQPGDKVTISWKVVPSPEQK